MHTSPLQTRTHATDGTAIIAALLAAGSLFVLSFLPLLSGFLGALALAAALVSRRRLRAEPALRGAGLSLAAFMVGAFAAVMTVAAYGVPLLVGQLFSLA
ncbi:hypothetical protein OH146_05135 [Salinibacterium sp. SYSU T00001]|uniref:hypothetical protein n=1 Tax=Homoserinimonas sedimenticola TaxID=2986805 RepID=UPI0022367A73|nr:hypothetical protein [Salinibacterium sedimenticola]MCW4385157.1 hypothetical protein [Salinibacterium sedimenticola]